MAKTNKREARRLWTHWNSMLLCERCFVLKACSISFSPWSSIPTEGWLQWVSSNSRFLQEFHEAFLVKGMHIQKKEFCSAVFSFLSFHLYIYFIFFYHILSSSYLFCPFLFPLIPLCRFLLSVMRHRNSGHSYLCTLYLSEFDNQAVRLHLICQTLRICMCELDAAVRGSTWEMVPLPRKSHMRGIWPNARFCPSLMPGCSIFMGIWWLECTY